MKLQLSILLLFPLIAAGGAAWSGIPESSGGNAPKLQKRSLPKRSALETRARRLLPKGWTLQTRGLPEGVVAVVLGPAGRDGRAVVTVRPWPDGFVRPDGGAVPDLLAAKLRLPAGFARWSTDGPQGPVADLPPESSVQVRYVFTSDALLTIVAPPRLLPDAYRRVLKAAKSLQASRKS